MFGLADTGAMTAERVRHYLEQIPDGVSELYFHPATARPSVWPANYRYADEAAALIDPEAQAIIARRGIEIMPFAELEHPDMTRRVTARMSQSGRALSV